MTKINKVDEIMALVDAAMWHEHQKEGQLAAEVKLRIKSQLRELVLDAERYQFVKNKIGDNANEIGCEAFDKEHCPLDESLDILMNPSGWIDFDGDASPVDPKLFIDVVLKSGVIDRTWSAGEVNWRNVKAYSYGDYFNAEIKYEEKD